MRFFVRFFVVKIPIPYLASSANGRGRIGHGSPGICGPGLASVAVRPYLALMTRFFDISDRFRLPGRFFGEMLTATARL